MNILIVAPYFYPDGGGAEVYTYEIAKGLSEKKHNVNVLCSNQSHGEKEDSLNEISVKRLNYDFKISSTPIKFSLYNNIKDLMRKNDFDAVNIDFYLPYYPDIAALVLKSIEIPCSITWHNDMVLDSLILNSMAKIYNKTINRVTLGRINTIVTPSPYCYNHSPFLKDFKEKMVWIPPGVDPEKYSTHKRKTIHDVYKISYSAKIVLFVGVMNKATTHKGVFQLIEAFSNVLKRYDDETYLVLVGRGDMISKYRELCHDLGIDKKVIFAGYVDQKTLIEYYQSSDMVVLPSLTVQEGFGMVLIEANACGKPVIGSRIGGIQYVIQEGETGLLVTPKDTESLANAIITLLEDENFAKRLGKNGRKKVEDFYNWDRAIEDTLKVYEDLK